MINIKYNNEDIQLNQEINFGKIAGGTVTKSFEITTDNVLGIKDVAFFLSPLNNNLLASLFGRKGSLKDYRDTLLLNDIDSTKGLKISQSYSITGTGKVINGKLVDLNRYEPIDIFIGQTVTIDGNPYVVDEFFPDKRTFEFTTTPPDGSYNYSCSITTNTYFFSDGNSSLDPITLLHGGGVILPNEEVTVSLSLSLPSSLIGLSSTAKKYLNLNVQYNDIITKLI